MTQLTEIAAIFLKLSLTAFGGPAAHVAMMHDEVVVRRKWLSDQEFLDLIGATNLIPGPNSTEVAIHVGFRRAGWLGLITGGLSFTAPAMLVVLALAWAYARYGSLPQVGWILSGIKPVVVAIILRALWVLGRKALKSWLLAAAALGALALFFVGINEILLLFAGGLLVMLVQNRSAAAPPACRAGAAAVGMACLAASRSGCLQPAGPVSHLSQNRGGVVRRGAMCCWPSCGRTWWCGWAG